MARILLSGIVLIFLTGSCKTLPKVTTFVDASSELRKGVKSGMEAVDASLRDGTGSRDLAADAKRLSELSAVMDKSLLGLTAYASALNNLVEAGNSGEKNALQAANSLTQIADQLAPPAVGELIGISAGTVSKIYGQIAKVKAARKLETIMSEAAPAIDDIRLILSKALGKLAEYNRAVYLNKQNILLAPNTIYKNALDYEEYLGKEQIILYEKLAIISEYKSSKTRNLEALRKQIDQIKEERDVDSRQASLVLQSQRIDTEQQRIAPVTTRARNLQKHIDTQYATIDQLFTKANDALLSWSKAHADIRLQLARKSLPNFQELSEIVDDLKALRAKLNALNS